MGLALIVFDCDGVILESVDAKTEAFSRIGAEFGEEARDGLVTYHRMYGGVSRFKKFEWLYETFLHKPISRDELLRLNEQFTLCAYNAVLECPLVPGIAEVLDRWHGQVPMYVASGAPQEELREIMARRGLDRYFDGIYGSPPEKTELLRGILERSGAHPTDAVMVGDASTDQYAAEATLTRFYGRGDYFKLSGYPWHTDLTKLNAYLEELID